VQPTLVDERSCPYLPNGWGLQTFEKFHCSLFGKHWHQFPKGETTQVMLSFLLPSPAPAVVVAQIALSSLSHLL